MAKQRAEYKNCDNFETNILPYIDVYIRIQSAKIASNFERLNTKGGSAPTDSCLSPSEIGKQILVQYSADYLFFSG